MGGASSSISCFYAYCDVVSDIIGLNQAWWWGGDILNFLPGEVWDDLFYI